MLNLATITEISKYITDRQTFFNFLNCCKYNQQFDSLFFDRYQIMDSSLRDYVWKVITDPEAACAFIRFVKKIRNLKTRNEYALETIAKINTNLCVIDIFFVAQVPKLPATVKKITLSVNQSKCNLENLPDSIEILILAKYHRTIEKLPNNLIHLEIDYIDTSIIRTFPPKLKKILLGEYYHNSFPTTTENIDNIPDTVEELRLGFYFNSPVTHWPDNLKSLDTYGHFNQPLDNLPFGLKTLEIGFEFEQSLDKLPESVDTLVYSMYCKMPLNNLPKTIKKLTLKHFCKSIELGEMTDTIEIIDILDEFLAIIKKFPASLKRLNISRSNPLLSNIQNILHNDKIFFID